jgi:hypothetical protein
MGTLESPPSGTGTPLQGDKKCFLFLKWAKGMVGKRIKKNPRYSVGVHCNNVIVI